MLPEIPQGLFPINNFTNCTNVSPCPSFLFSGAKKENLGSVLYSPDSIHFPPGKPSASQAVYKAVRIGQTSHRHSQRLLATGAFCHKLGTLPLRSILFDNRVKRTSLISPRWDTPNTPTAVSKILFLKSWSVPCVRLCFFDVPLKVYGVKPRKNSRDCSKINFCLPTNTRLLVLQYEPNSILPIEGLFGKRIRAMERRRKRIGSCVYMYSLFSVSLPKCVLTSCLIWWQIPFILLTEEEPWIASERVDHTDFQLLVQRARSLEVLTASSNKIKKKIRCWTNRKSQLFVVSPKNRGPRANHCPQHWRDRQGATENHNLPECKFTGRNRKSQYSVPCTQCLMCGLQREVTGYTKRQSTQANVRTTLGSGRDVGIIRARNLKQLWLICRGLS